MSEHEPGPFVTPGHEDAELPAGTSEVIDTSGPGDNPADVTDPNPPSPPIKVPEGYRRLKVAYPQTYFDSGVDGIIISSAGTDVRDDQAQAVLDAAKASVGVTLEEVG